MGGTGAATRFYRCIGVFVIGRSDSHDECQLTAPEHRPDYIWHEGAGTIQKTIAKGGSHRRS